MDRKIRQSLGVAAIAILASLLPLAGEESGPGESPPAAATSPAPPGELARFGAFLDEHPFIEARLQEDAALANNPAFLRNHPLFARYLARHPGLGAELAAHPRWLLHRELIRRSAAPITPAQLAEFDRFLDQHPRAERLLVQHPGLLRQPEFLSRNPELHEYLRRHPAFDRPREPLARPGR